MTALNWYLLRATLFCSDSFSHSGRNRLVILISLFLGRTNYIHPSTNHPRPLASCSSKCGPQNSSILGTPGGRGVLKRKISGPPRPPDSDWVGTGTSPGPPPTRWLVCPGNVDGRFRSPALGFSFPLWLASSFRKYQYLDPSPRESDLIGLETF